MWSILSDDRMGLPFTIVAGPRQRSHSWVWVPRDSWPYFTVSYSRHPQPGGPGPVYIYPRNRVAQLYTQTLGSLFVASYDSQGYGGGIRTRLHVGNASSHVGQYASLSWHKASMWCLRPDLYFFFISVRQLQACWYGALWRGDGSVVCQSHSQQ
jgi:hypothetical protein